MELLGQRDDNALGTAGDEDVDEQFAVNFRAHWTAMTAETWAPQSIRVNGTTPGGTATEMIAAWEAATPGIIERGNATIPLGRMAEAREVAEVAAWLLSDRASMVTGAVVPVDGGSGA